MAKAQDINYVTKTGYPKAVTIVNADGTNKKDLITGETDETIVKGIGITSDDGTARDVALWWYDGSTSYQVGYIAVPASSGTVIGKKAVQALKIDNVPCAKLDNSGNPVFQLKLNEKLQVSVDVAVTAAKTLTVSCQAEDF